MGLRMLITTEKGGKNLKNFSSNKQAEKELVFFRELVTDSSERRKDFENQAYERAAELRTKLGNEQHRRAKPQQAARILAQTLNDLENKVYFDEIVENLWYYQEKYADQEK